MNQSQTQGLGNMVRLRIRSEGNELNAKRKKGNKAGKARIAIVRK